GRPISFQMDLYSPLFVDRPTERLELFQSLRAVTYSGALNRADDRLVQEQAGQGKSKEAENESLRRGADRDANALGRPAAGAPPGKPGAGGGFGGDFKKDLAEKLNLGGSVQSAASAAKLGNFFQYLIEKPVQLPRQKSALLPIVAKDVEGKRVSI